jgi:hypothetical protein
MEQLTPNWIVSGIVEEILPSNKIKLWIDGISETQTVDIDPVMPEWMLVANVSFRTKIPRECIKRQSLDGVVWGEFETQPYSDLSFDELWDEFNKCFDFNKDNS